MHFLLDDIIVCNYLSRACTINIRLRYMQYMWPQLNHLLLFKLLSVSVCQRMASHPNIVSKKNTNAPVWTYFGLKADENGLPISKEAAICRLCFSSVSSKGGNTSNLYSHLKNHHAKEHAELKQGMAAAGNSSSSTRSRSNSQAATSSSHQPTIVAVVNQSKSYERNGKKWQELTDTVTRCLCKDMLPIYTVEKEGFGNMLKKFDSRYELPSRKYFFETAIPALYNREREKVVNELSNLKYFAATTDM